MPTFPTELFEEIIAWIPAVCNWFDERYRALLSCSLVCSAWLPASRHQLFQTLYIQTPERYDLLVSRVLHSDKMRINLLSVRKVALFHSLGTPRYQRPFVIEFAGHLPIVTDMYLDSDSAEPFVSHPTSGVVMSRFALVQSLVLVDCKFPSFGVFRRTLTSLPSLNNLRLEYPSWPDPAADLSPSLSHGASTVRRPALLWLTVEWDTEPPDRRRAQQFMAWLSETETSSSLLDLNLGFFHRTLDDQDESIATFGRSLWRFGRGLRKLEIEVGRGYDPELEMFFCSLESLNVLLLYFRSAIQPDIWVQLERIVHSLPCPKQLVELEIDVGSSDRPLSLSQLDGLEAFDAALQPELFKDLQAVQFHVEYIKEEGDPEEGPALTEPMLAVIKNKLPKLFARNIIKVTAFAFKL